VDSVTGEKNKFLTKLMYELRDGTVTQPTKMRFQLVCDTVVSLNPLQSCEPKHLRIHDATRPGSLANLI
jgi:hypothetical protein